MGSLIGNYIHLTAEGYKTKGTNEWSSKEQQNITAQIFNNHKESILKQAEKFKITDDLATISRNYNDSNKAQYEALKKLITDTNNTYGDGSALARTLVSKLGNFSNSAIDEIISNLKWDDARQTLYYGGDKLLSQGSEKAAIKTLGSAESFRYINTIMVRAEQLRERIRQYPEMGQDLKNGQIARIDQVIKDLKEFKGFQERTEEELKKLKSKNARKYKGILPIDVANAKYAELLDITRVINGVQDINSTLQWHFAELLGNLIGETGVQVAYQTIKQTLERNSFMGTKQTTSNKGGIAITQRIDLPTLEKNNIKLKKNGTYTDPSGKVHTSYLFSGIGDPRNQKADVELTINGSTTPLNISLKNTSLTKEINEQTKSLAQTAITLQDRSSLLLYLLGIEQADKGMANHYLNIFAKHKDKKALGDDIHKSAVESFKLALFYSALTGANQLRTGGQVQLFAVYNKSPSGLDVVQFFDTYSLIKDANKSINTAARFSPSIDKLTLKNTRINRKGVSIKENINIRLTNLLIDARNYNISVSIAKNFLQSVYKGK